MQKTLVLTLIGDDRPGLVESVAEVVSEKGANWVESRMAHLAGQFAGILRVSALAEDAESLVDSLRALGGASELAVTVSVEDETAASSPPGTREIQLELVGQDRPGIVAQMSKVLVARGINVEELKTECSSAPMSGETIFRADARLSVPSEVTTDDLRAAFEAVAEDLMVDVTIDE